MSDERSPIALVVTVAMLTAAVASLSQFPWVQSELSTQYRAFSRYPSTQVGDVVDNHWASTQERYGLYADLHHHAAGAVLTAPTDLNVSTEQLLGLSRLHDVQFVQETGGEVDADQLAALQDDIVAAGEDRALGPYAIAVTSSVQELVAVPGPDGLLIVDRALLPETREADG